MYKSPQGPTCPRKPGYQIKHTQRQQSFKHSSSNGPQTVRPLAISAVLTVPLSVHYAPRRFSNLSIQQCRISNSNTPSTTVVTTDPQYQNVNRKTRTANTGPQTRFSSSHLVTFRHRQHKRFCVQRRPTFLASCPESTSCTYDGTTQVFNQRHSSFD